MTINSFLPIVTLTQSFAQISRDCKFYDLSRNENDSEHSYQLAIAVWYLANTLDLELDREKLFAYSLIHDLVEIYAGDTAPFSSDQTYNDSVTMTKDDRERAAFDRLRAEYSEFKELFVRILEYEKKNDNESRFVYILDKLLADTNCFLSGERYYLDRNYTYEQWLDWYDSKFVKLGKLNSTESDLLNMYKSFMREHRKFFFGK